MTCILGILRMFQILFEVVKSKQFRVYPKPVVCEILTTLLFRDDEANGFQKIDLSEWFGHDGCNLMLYSLRYFLGKSKWEKKKGTFYFTRTGTVFRLKEWQEQREHRKGTTSTMS